VFVELFGSYWKRFKMMLRISKTTRKQMKPAMIAPEAALLAFPPVDRFSLLYNHTANDKLMIRAITVCDMISPPSA